MITWFQHWSLSRSPPLFPLSPPPPPSTSSKVFMWHAQYTHTCARTYSHAYISVRTAISRSRIVFRLSADPTTRSFSSFSRLSIRPCFLNVPDARRRLFLLIREKSRGFEVWIMAKHDGSQFIDLRTRYDICALSSCYLLKDRFYIIYTLRSHYSFEILYVSQVSMILVKVNAIASVASLLQFGANVV